MKSSSWHHLFHLTVLGLALPLVVSGCLGVGSKPNGQSTIGITNPHNHSPTPTAIPYLVGAFVSDNTFTSTSGSIVVYVVFHHGQLPQSGGQVNLYFHYENGGGIAGLNNQAGTETTGPDGFASFFMNFSGLPPNRPIGIDVRVHFTGMPDIVKKDATSFSVVSSGG